MCIAECAFPLPISAGGEGDLAGPHLLEGVAGKEGVTFFRRGLQFLHNNKLESEMFNDKKFINTNIVITKNKRIQKFKF